MLTATDIRYEVEKVLRRTSNYLTAYQILERLPSPLRDRLIAERGKPGQGNGQRYTAVTVVTQAAGQICTAEDAEKSLIYIDGGNIYFEVGQDLIPAGHEACACYRIRERADTASKQE